MSKKIEHNRQAKQEWLAQRLRNSKKNPTSSGISLQPRPINLPLSFAQQRLWFLDQWEPESSAYLLPFAWRLQGPVHVSTLETSFTEIVARHESLRTKVSFVDGTPVQIIEPIRPVSFPFHDLTSLPETAIEAEIERLIREEAHRPFDLTTGPLWRGQLLGLGDEEHVLLLTFHHIITDGWSMGVFFKEWTMLYKMQITGQISEWPPLPLQYADYAIWQRQRLQGEELDRQLSYWSTQLAGAPPSLDLPTDFPRPAQQSYQGQRLAFTLPQHLMQRLQALSRQEGVTLFMTMLATFQLLLFRYASQNDIVIGTPIAGRTHTNLEGLIGFFVNTLVLRSPLKGHLTFQKFLQQVRETCLEAYAHQDLPFEKLVETLQPVRDPSRHPLFQVMFQLHQADLANELAFPQVQVQAIKTAFPTAKFDLALELVQRGQTLDGTIVFNTELFMTSTIQELAIHYEQLLEGVTKNIHQPIKSIPLLPDTERRQLLVEWNDTKQDYPASTGAHQLFEEQVERTPEAIALIFEEQHVTYQALNKRANQLAHFLREQGVGPEVRVGLCFERSVDMLISVLGVLKAGGSYVPLDPTYPEERQQYIVTHSRPQCVLTQTGFCSWMADTIASRIDIDPDGSCYTYYPSDNPSILHSRLNLAYVIYTSGSTGKPKGVMVTHQSLSNLLITLQQHVGVDPTSTLLAVTSLSFDISVFELLGPLIAGGRLVLASREVASDGIALQTTLQAQAITLMQATPSTWSMLIQSNPAALSRPMKILCGGEALTSDLAQQLKSWGASIWNVYGPTETTIWSTLCKLESSNQPISIGRPLANTTLFLVDQRQELIPIGLTGEILIGGDGLASGYQHNPTLTAEKFIPHPFSPKHGARLYRSGDRAKYRPDGALEYLGRQDNQVKLRGFRIECGEIETTLTAHPSIREAIVLCREDTPGNKTLVAYVVMTSHAPPTQNDMSTWVRRTLPDYMIPSMFMLLEALPLTPNGKVDRKALPAPDQTLRVSTTTYVPPRTPTEELIAVIWRELLKRDQIGIHDNFFELGGHSLLVTQVVARLRPILSTDLSIRTFFNQPTIAELSATLEPSEATPAKSTTTPLRPQVQEGPPPLSFAQQRLWFLDQWEPGSTAYLLPFAWQITGPLNISALESSLTVLAAEHDCLRTSIDLVDGQPVQIIASPTPVLLSIQELTSFSTATCEEHIQSFVHQEQQQPFELKNGPLWRSHILRLGPEEHVLLLTFHHLITDAWSMGLFFQALQTLYTATITGQPVSLPSKPIQYVDFSIWQRQWLQGEELNRQLTYWCAQLADAPTSLDLSTDFPRPPQVSYRGKHLSFSLPASLTHSLNSLSRQEGVTLFMTMLAAFQLLLFRYTGQRDFLVGSPIAGRTHAELENLIGLFINTLVLRTRFTGRESFRDLVRQVRETCLQAYAHQDLPFEKLVETLQPLRDLSRHPLFQVIFQLHQTDLMRELTLPHVQMQSIRRTAQTAKFDLSLELNQRGETLDGTIVFNTDIFETDTITRLATHYQILLEGLLEDPAQAISHLPLLNKEERQQLILGWNKTNQDYPGNTCLHQLFEKQVVLNPEVIAIAFEDQQLTYQELNKRANQLAHFLRQRGIGPDVRVGLCVERGLEMITGLLGILKAGGTYVPLDPTYPEERQQYILTHSQPQCILTQAGLCPWLTDTTTSRIDLDQDGSCYAHCSTSNPDLLQSWLSLAYVIYTSGSTGAPKGVMVTHQSVTNLLLTLQEHVEVDRTTVLLAVTSLSFDISVFELFGPLISGGRVVLISRQVATDGLALYTALQTQAITLMQATPSTWSMLIQSNPAALSRPMKILCGGEALTSDLAQQLKSWGASIWNVYGPTETTIWSTLCKLESSNQPISIGRPLANTTLFLVDQRQELIPIGLTGEILIGGDGLASGYQHNPTLTAEKFIPHPFSPKHGARLYRSGDRAKYRPDGALEYLGRQDNQVKLRGFRIECGEIETTLTAHPSIREAIVLCREDTPGNKTLVAYVVMTSHAPPTQNDMSTWVRRTLPDYMIPSMFMLLEALPLTPNGKVDRKALPAPDQTQRAGTMTYVPPRTSTEELVADIWRELLKVDQIGIHDNFFEMGGHSLLVTQVVARLRPMTSSELSIRSFFDRPTIAELSVMLQPSQSTYSKSGTSSLRPQTQEGPPPLSFAQQRLWFLEQWDPGSTAYLLPFAWRLHGSLDVHALETSLTEIVAKHESLRTSIGLSHGQPVQIIAPATSVSLSVKNLMSFSTARCEEYIQSAIHHERHQPFDLATGPLWRSQLLRLGPEEYVFLLTLHHLITDAWSMGLFFQELCTLYTAQITGQPASLPSKPVQYGDFSIWQRQWLQGEELDRQSKYWGSQLADPPISLDLPTDFTRPPQVSYRGTRLSFALPSPLTRSLTLLSRQEGVTLFMTMLAAFQLLLFRYTGHRDILVGTPIAGRTHAELEGLIGFFVNTLVLRTGFTGRESFCDLVRQVRETCLEAYAHQDLPFEKLVEALQPVRDPSRHPLFQVSFQLHQENLMSELILPQVQTQSIHGTSQAAKFDLSLELLQRGETLDGCIVFNTELFEAETIIRLAAHYQILLEGLVEDPLQAVSHIPLLDQEERQQLLIDWNPARVLQQPLLCVHHLVDSQVTHNPNTIAVVEGDEHLTYSALNLRAAKLAQYLQDCGVGPEVHVGLYLERGINQIISLLAILKAGGAYVPLDPTTPIDRLEFILQDANVVTMLTSATLLKKLLDARGPSYSSNALKCPVITVDVEWPDLADRGASSFPLKVTGENLAYVMYTSGSTGQPKGVGIPHRAVVRLIQNQTQISWPTQVNCLQLASSAFDAATFEIWACLGRGGTLVLAPPNLPSFDELGALLQRHQITVLWLTAGLFHQLIDWNIQTLKPLQILLAGGDVLSAAHIRRMTAQLPTCQLINGYGPTENTTFTCWFPFPKDDNWGNSVPIGRPIDQTQVYVLDWQQYLRPRGLSGELTTSGQGLARGYFQQPALTAEKFIPHPYSTQPGERLYRSGDLVKYRPNGILDFLGRRDHQVKIRGYRIECGEIETNLARHPDVQDALVLPREDSIGNKRLVAYIVSEKGSSPLYSTFRDYLSPRLPSYMIPSHYVFLDAFPLTSNGKIDQSNLPVDGQLSSQEKEAYVAPRNSLESQLANIWETVLGKQPIGVTENFFNLGGESLMAVRLCSEIERALQQKVPVSLIFQAQTIEQLAQILTKPGENELSPLMIPIQSSGSNPPIFGVLFGATFKPFMNNYSNQPYYMFFNQGHDGNAALHTTVEKIAFWYLKEVRTIQPQGPYFLAGYSFGGMIAYEMAQQLRQQGETIALLALVDPTLPHSQEMQASGELLLETLSIETVKNEDQQSPSYMTSPRTYFTKLSTLFLWRVNSVKTRSTVIMKSILSRMFFRIGYPLPPSLRPWYRNHVVQEAARQYIPQKYPGQISLFKSTNYVETPWRELCAEVVEAGTFPTGHLDLVDGSHTETLLHELMTCLKKAQEKPRVTR